jgi:hypothetical protein
MRTALAYAPETIGTYHATNVTTLYKILKGNKILLSTQAFGRGGANADGMNSKYAFYLSLSRERYGGYAFANNKLVTLVLDERKLKAAYKIVPYDYWGSDMKKEARRSRAENRDPDSLRRNTESEDRLMSNHASIPASKYVKSIHVLLRPSEHQSIAEQRCLFRIKQMFPNTVIHTYTSRQRFQVLDVTKSVPLSELDIADHVDEPDDQFAYDPDKERSSSSRDTLEFVEQAIDLLRGRRTEVPTLVSKHYNESDLIRVIDVGFHNYSADHGNDQLDAAMEKLARMMAKRNIRSTAELVARLRAQSKLLTRPSVDDVVVPAIKSWFTRNGNKKSEKVNGDENECNVIEDNQFIHMDAQLNGKVRVYRTEIPTDVLREHNWVDVAKLAEALDRSEAEIRSESVGSRYDRMNLLQAIGFTEGYENLDGYPLEMSKQEFVIRYVPADEAYDELVTWGGDVSKDFPALVRYLLAEKPVFKSDLESDLAQYQYTLADVKQELKAYAGSESENMHNRTCNSNNVAVSAADDFKIVCSMKLPAKSDLMILDVLEGKQLRNRVFERDASPVKILNIYKKRIRNTITPDKYLDNSISSLQLPRTHTIMRLKNGSEVTDFSVELVNSHGANVYSKDDITTNMTLKVTPMTKSATARVSKNLIVISKTLAMSGIKHEIVLAASSTATASDSVWIVKGPKGRVSNKCPKTALAEYVKLYGSRGNISVAENKREGDFLVFMCGCKSFRGTVKEIAPQLEAC